jgi:hypothetical protein
MQAYSVGFSDNPAIARGGSELCFESTECPTADYEFLTLYPTNFTVLDEMLAYSHYWTNPEVICINQDVPTCFYAVQRSRLPTIVMLLDRGLSDTNTGEVNQNNSTRKIQKLTIRRPKIHLIAPAVAVSERLLFDLANHNVC